MSGSKREFSNKEQEMMKDIMKIFIRGVVIGGFAITAILCFTHYNEFKAFAGFWDLFYNNPKSLIGIFIVLTIAIGINCMFVMKRITKNLIQLKDLKEE